MKTKTQSVMCHCDSADLMEEETAPDLMGLPSELVVAALKHCDAHTLARVDSVSTGFHAPSHDSPSLVEQTLRQRAEIQGSRPPLELPPGEHSWTQLLLWSDRSSSMSRQLVAAGTYHSAFIDPQGRLLTRGTEVGDMENCPGLLGHGAYVRVLPTPAVVPSMPAGRVRSVAAGHRHSLVLTEAGTVLSFGRGWSGALGHGDELDQLQPKVIAALGGLRIAAISAGAGHSLAMTEAGDVLSFGCGSSGQLGHGDTFCRRRPAQILTLAGHRVTSISAGGCHSLVVAASGTLYAFGRGEGGRLGHGDESTVVLVRLESRTIQPSQAD